MDELPPMLVVEAAAAAVSRLDYTAAALVVDEAGARSALRGLGPLRPSRGGEHWHYNRACR